MTPRPAPLVSAGEVASPKSYRQLSRSDDSAAFRRDLKKQIERSCRAEGDRRSLDTFSSLADEITREGAVSFAGLLPPARFDAARQAYDEEMQAKGSRGALHNYLNLAESEALLANANVWETFAHPLLVALIAYALGGPVKIVDLRAKDTQPIDVVGRDNTLHLDNSPFMDEFKVIVTWTLGTGRGPSGQGLTYLPRTNRLFRQCLVNAAGEAWSDEDGCIFPSQARVDEALSAQAHFFEDGAPRVVHLKDIDAPCHTIFAASRLVHHRYRTSAGGPRSAMMATFHRCDDSAGLLGVRPRTRSDLDRFLLAGGGAPAFLEAVSGEAERLLAALKRASDESGLLIDANAHLLGEEGFRAWYARLCGGVSLNRLRFEMLARSRANGVPDLERLVVRMQHDLQGPLNMPLYADIGEESRKRARILIREMPPEKVLEIVTSMTGESLPRNRVVPQLPTVRRQIEELRSNLLVLDELITSRGSRIIGDGLHSLDGRGAVASLGPFLADLRVSVGWVDDVDSLVTCHVFAVVGAALACELFDLGDVGRELTVGLMERYVQFVAPSLEITD